MAETDTLEFASFYMAGFDSATHRRRDRVRVDSIAAQQHDRFAYGDYAAAARHELRTVRDGLRWHLIEREPGVYDWSSWTPMLEAAQDAGVQVIWDIWHYGWPDWLDIWSPEFVERLAAFARAAAEVQARYSSAVPFWCPVNEISFFAFIAGACEEFAPWAIERAPELKHQLIRASVAATDAVRDVDPRARVMWCEPSVHVIPASHEPDAVSEAHGWLEASYEAFDMLSGRRDPELGGRPDILDIVGLNFYPHNQWVAEGRGAVTFGHYNWRPFSELLLAAHRRYGRPLVVAETGAEGCGRSAWLHYVAAEVEEAQAQGADVRGVCLYPVCDYPGWDNDRLCPTGLFGAPDAEGVRPVHARMAKELARLQAERRPVESPMARLRRAFSGGGRSRPFAPALARASQRGRAARG